MKNLKSLIVVLCSFIALGLQAQQGPNPSATTVSDKVEISYQDYLKMQEAYLKGKISKEKLLKAFNQVADQLDDTCHPQPKPVVRKTASLDNAQGKIDLTLILAKNNDLKKRGIAKN